MENNFYNIFDSHAHYDDKWFDEDREVLLSSMKENGVCGIVNNAVDLKTAKVCIDFCEKYDFMYGAVGFHPENLPGKTALHHGNSQNKVPCLCTEPSSAAVKCCSCE